MSKLINLFTNFHNFNLTYSDINRSYLVAGTSKYENIFVIINLIDNKSFFFLIIIIRLKKINEFIFKRLRKLKNPTFKRLISLFSETNEENLFKYNTQLSVRF